MSIICRVFAAVIMGCMLGGAAHASPTDFSAEVTQTLDRLEAPDVPGFAHATTENGETTKTGTDGVLVLGSAEPVQLDTPFILGSVSKSFTALAVMQLIEAGKLTLGDTIAQHLNAFSGQTAGAITVQQLLSHTSGYSMLQGNQSQDDFSMDDDALERRVASAASTTPERAPGSTWDYSNINYQILGRLIEVVSGQSYAEYLEQSVLGPAGMGDSYVHDGSTRPGAATGHRPWFGGHRALSQNMTGRGSGPQGGITSSARDMARYLALMMNGEDDILSAAGKAQMMAPASDVSPEYGFGWFVDTENGVVYHSGSNPGFEALATMIPAQKKGTAVLVNASSGLAFGSTVETRYGITSATIGVPYAGESGQATMRIAFVAMAVLPFAFLFGLWRVWLARKSPRRAGVPGALLLWLPSLLGLGLAWVLVSVIPSAFGAPLGAANAFQPDTGFLLITGAVTAAVWAVTRITVMLLRPKTAS